MVRDSIRVRLCPNFLYILLLSPKMYWIWLLSVILTLGHLTPWWTSVLKPHAAWQSLTSNLNLFTESSSFGVVRGSIKQQHVLLYSKSLSVNRDQICKSIIVGKDKHEIFNSVTLQSALWDDPPTSFFCEELSVHHYRLRIQATEDICSSYSAPLPSKLIYIPRKDSSFNSNRVLAPVGARALERHDHSLWNLSSYSNICQKNPNMIIFGISFSNTCKKKKVLPSITRAFESDRQDKKRWCCRL